MFDVGFSELLIIALVALIVIGPERLPKVARTVGVLLGRLQRYVSDVKSDINREMQLDELKKMQDQVSSQAQEMQNSLTSDMRTVEESLNQTIATPQATPVESATTPFPTASASDPATPRVASDPVALALAPEQQMELGLDSRAERATG